MPIVNKTPKVVSVGCVGLWKHNSDAIFPSSLPMTPRARLNLIPNLLSSQKTIK